MTEHVKIYILGNTLSDGSKTYDVVVGNLRLPAVTLDDAGKLAVIIRDGIDVHTLVEVTYDEEIY